MCSKGETPLLKEVFDQEGIEKAYRSSILGYLIPLQAHDEATYRHSVRVGFLARQISWYARKPGVTSKMLLCSGLLHDIGKIFISAELLRKRGGFTLEDRHKVEPHVKFGWKILRGAHEQIAQIIVRHHIFSSRPYPTALPVLPRRLEERKGRIEAAARLLTLADYYDAFVTRDDGFSEPFATGKKQTQFLSANKDLGDLISVLEKEGVLTF